MVTSIWSIGYLPSHVVSCAAQGLQCKVVSQAMIDSALNVRQARQDEFMGE